MVAHEIGHTHEDILDDEGNPTFEEIEGKQVKRTKLMPFSKMVKYLHGRFQSIIVQSEAGAFEGYLTDGENFRHEAATIQEYKGQRKDSPRHRVDQCKDYLNETFDCLWCLEFEADDAMAMGQWDEYAELHKEFDGDEDAIRDSMHTVIATRDKDLDTVPGWKFKWALKDKDAVSPYFIRLIDATRNFYRQLIMGDASDNIKGLYGIGPSKTAYKALDNMETEEEMYAHTLKWYVKYYGNYGITFLKENARLLWMWRKPDDYWIPPDERDNTWSMW